MYYKDQYGNVSISDNVGTYTNNIHPGGIGYHPLSRESFETQDVTTFFQKYKMWFLYIIIIILIIIVIRWMINRNKNQQSVFY